MRGNAYIPKNKDDIDSRAPEILLGLWSKVRHRQQAIKPAVEALGLRGHRNYNGTPFATGAVKPT